MMSMFPSLLSFAFLRLIVRDNPSETVPSIWFTLDNSPRWTGVFKLRLFAWGFDGLWAALVAMFMGVDRELGTSAFHGLDDSMWVGSRSRRVVKRCRLFVCRLPSETMSVPDRTTNIATTECLTAWGFESGLSTRKIVRLLIFRTNDLELLSAQFFAFSKRLFCFFLCRFRICLDFYVLVNTRLLPRNLLAPLLILRCPRLSILDQVLLLSLVIAESPLSGNFYLGFVCISSLVLGFHGKLLFRFTPCARVMGSRRLLCPCLKLHNLIIQGVATT